MARQANTSSRCDAVGHSTARGLLRSVLPLGLWLFTSAAVAAPPELKTIFPAGGTRGQTVNVLVAGKVADGPLSVWVDGPGLKFQTLDRRDKFSVTIAADAEPGQHFVRLLDAFGASSLRPFVVGTLPELEEVEPNDGRDQTQEISAPAVVVNGRLAKAGDVDSFAVTLRQGQTFVASLDAEALLGSPMDAVLQLTDSEGFVLRKITTTMGSTPGSCFRCRAMAATWCGCSPIPAWHPGQ